MSLPDEIARLTPLELGVLIVAFLLAACVVSKEF